MNIGQFCEMWGFCLGTINIIPQRFNEVSNR